MKRMVTTLGGSTSPLNMVPGLAWAGQWLLACIRMVSFAVILVIALAAAALVRLVLFAAPMAWRLRAGLAVLRCFSRCAIRVFGIDVHLHGPLPGTGCLIVANHRSYLDVVALASVVPAVFLAKRSVRSWPLLGWGADLVGTCWVQRDDPEDRLRAREHLCQRLEQGFTVVNFPEGTTSSREVPLHFKPGLFKAVAGRAVVIQPVHIGYAHDGGTDWVDDATFLDHLFRLASRPCTPVSLTFGKRLLAKRQPDGELLCRQAYGHVVRPQVDWNPEDETWLKPPRLKCWVSTLQKGRFKVEVYDQPGRWMGRSALARLHEDLVRVATASMEQVPTYGVFSPRRDAFNRRIIAMVYDGMEPVGFTAMVYLPFTRAGQTRPIIHLGLTMIAQTHRGMRLQTPLFRKVFVPALANQRRLGFTITNIAASPAGIGATSDYFQDVFPNYRRSTTRQPFHMEVAEQVLGNFRAEFGCSQHAIFNPGTFVVHGSNQPDGGGAFQFIKDDPVSSYRVEECNQFCRDLLDFSAGDELFQVGRVNFLEATARVMLRPGSTPPRQRLAEMSQR